MCPKKLKRASNNELLSNFKKRKNEVSRPNHDNNPIRIFSYISGNNVAPNKEGYVLKLNTWKNKYYVDDFTPEKLDYNLSEEELEAVISAIETCPHFSSTNFGLNLLEFFILYFGFMTILSVVVGLPLWIYFWITVYRKSMSIFFSILFTIFTFSFSPIFCFLYYKIFEREKKLYTERSVREIRKYLSLIIGNWFEYTKLEATALHQGDRIFFELVSDGKTN